MKENKAVLLLLAASLIWGFTFAFQSQAASAIGPFMYNGIRMCIGFIVLLPLLLRILKGKDKYNFTVMPRNYKGIFPDRRHKM